MVQVSGITSQVECNHRTVAFKFGMQRLQPATLNQQRADPENGVNAPKYNDPGFKMNNKRLHSEFQFLIYSHD